MTEKESRDISYAISDLGEATQTLVGQERDRLITIMLELDRLAGYTEDREGMEAWLAECYPQVSTTVEAAA